MSLPGSQEARRQRINIKIKVKSPRGTFYPGRIAAQSKLMEVVMAIYGIGAFYEADVSSDFLAQGVACIGRDVQDAPALHRLLSHLRVGDIIYIKAHPPGKSLTIKTVGIILEEEVKAYAGLGRGVRVRWAWNGNHMVREAANEKYNVRNNSLYEEVSPVIQDTILALLFSMLKPRP
jgi:hypothetical protein